MILIAGLAAAGSNRASSLLLECHPASSVHAPPGTLVDLLILSRPFNRNM
jgi:hypothetical protein